MSRFGYVHQHIEAAYSVFVLLGGQSDAGLHTAWPFSERAICEDKVTMCLSTTRAQHTFCNDL
jgi:hypothetical protein